MMEVDAGGDEYHMEMDRWSSSVGVDWWCVRRIYVGAQVGVFRT